ncbi:MAG: hypothetical protein IH988_03675 [Planctomycetes bacterium]|nr:hypothetical protein [Planctomycetota bacterium]
MASRRFRFEIVAVVLTILAMAWFLKGAAPIEWHSVTEWAGLEDGERFSKLGVLAAAMLGVVAVVRILRERADQ